MDFNAKKTDLAYQTLRPYGNSPEQKEVLAQLREFLKERQDSDLTQ